MGKVFKQIGKGGDFGGEKQPGDYSPDHRYARSPSLRQAVKRARIFL